LDYGAGFGNSLIIANNMGFESYGLEYSEERIEYLRKKSISVIKLNDSTKFDFIIANQILEHVTDPRALLNDLYLRLNDDGIVFLSVPNCPKIENQLTNVSGIRDGVELKNVFLKASVSALQHINFFNNKNLKLLIKSCEFEIVFMPVSEIVSSIITKNIYKTFLAPFYRYQFGTTFYLKKK
jgi:2-polyprenyl-3-methyl-5-hydroxy-6-metoxy-1,4-benzoquinol methylase